MEENQMQVKVVAKFKVSEEKKAAAIEVLEKLVDATRQEDGCVFYELQQHTEDTTCISMLEMWESQEALDLHAKTEHYEKYVGEVGPLLDGPAEVDFYTLIK